MALTAVIERARRELLASTSEDYLRALAQLGQRGAYIDDLPEWPMPYDEDPKLGTAESGQQE